MTAGLASSTIMGSSGTTLNISGTVSSISGTVTGATTRITGPIQFVQFLNNTVNINGAFIAENSIATSQLNVNNGGTLYLGSSSGTINLNTATGTFSILSGGTLAVNASDRLVNMSGSTGGPMSNAGTILVGAGQGLTISGGSYTQSVGGTFQTEVASNTSFGKLRLFSGTINLAAGTKIDVLVQPGASLTAGTLLNNVMLASSITGGAFSSFSVSDNSTDYDFEVDYCRTGDTLECNTVGTNLGLRIKAAGALGRTAATRPLVTTGVVQTVFQMLRMGNNVVQAVSSSNSSGGGINTGDVLRDRHGWIKPLYMQSKQDDEGTVSGYKADSYGIIGGMDGTYNEKTRLGVAGSYTSSKVESNRSLATHDANIDAWRLIGYGSYALSPNTEFTFQGDYSTGTIKGSRQIAVGDVASSKYRNETWHFSGALSRVLDVTPGKTTFTPTVRLDYTRSYDHSYTESGGSTNLAVQSNVSEEAIVTIQGKLNHAISSTTTLSVNASAGYDTIGQQSSLTAAALGGGSTFVATGLAPQREVYQLGVGSLTKLAQGGEINVRYDLETRRGYTGQSVSVKYRKPF
jgi:hypothetical protein